MNQGEAVKAIYQRWMTQWPGLSGGVPYVFDNDVADDAATYARVRITFVDEQQQTLGQIGTRKFLHMGMIEVELHAPGNAGRKQLDALSQFVRTIYAGQRFGATGTEEGVITYATSIQDYRSTHRPNARQAAMLASTTFEFVEVR